MKNQVTLLEQLIAFIKKLEEHKEELGALYAKKVRETENKKKLLSFNQMLLQLTREESNIVRDLQENLNEHGKLLANAKHFVRNREDDKNSNTYKIASAFIQYMETPQNDFLTELSKLAKQEEENKLNKGENKNPPTAPHSDTKNSQGSTVIIRTDSTETPAISTPTSGDQLTIDTTSTNPPAGKADPLPQNPTNTEPTDIIVTSVSNSPPIQAAGQQVATDDRLSLLIEKINNEIKKLEKDGKRDHFAFRKGKKAQVMKNALENATKLSKRIDTCNFSTQDLFKNFLELKGDKPGDKNLREALNYHRLSVYSNGQSFFKDSKTKTLKNIETWINEQSSSETPETSLRR